MKALSNRKGREKSAGKKCGENQEAPMGFYDNYILPRLIDMGCGAEPISKQRQKVA